jgi:hypothetical protein
MLALPEQVQAGTNQEVAMIRFLRPRTLVAVLRVLGLSVAVYGLAAANVVLGSSRRVTAPAPSAGTTSRIHYALSGANPGNIAP